MVASPLGTAAAPESICAGLQLCAPQQPRCAEGFYCYKGQLCLPIKAEVEAKKATGVGEEKQPCAVDADCGEGQKCGPDKNCYSKEFIEGVKGKMFRYSYKLDALSMRKNRVLFLGHSRCLCRILEADIRKMKN